MQASNSPISRQTSRVITFLGAGRGVVALAIVFVVGIFLTPENLTTGRSVFLTWQTQSDILYENVEYGLLACGMTLVILSAGIDLSVGSILGLIGMLFALLIIGVGCSAPVAILICMLAGLLLGGVNGFFISKFNLQPFVVTLAMMVAARGLAKMVSGYRTGTQGMKIQAGAADWYSVKEGTPQIFDWLTTRVNGIGLQPATLLFLLCIVIMYFVVRYSAWGRRLYAIGGNEEVGRLSGIRVAQTKISAYMMCAMFVALAGVVSASKAGIGDPEAGFTYELDAIAAVVIGGTPLTGGQGGMGFTLIGVLIIAYINKILSLNTVQEPSRLLVKGLIIVVAVLIQQRRKY